MSDEPKRGGEGPSRREVVALAATVPLVRVRTGHAADRRRLGPVEFRTLEHLAEQIIPTDDHSPGARAAGAADTIDRMLAELEPRYPDHRKRLALWRTGLAAIDREAQARHGRAYADLGFAEQRALLEPWAEAPATDAARRGFFTELKSRVTWAYYTSEVGIHQELGYLGNTYSAEFEGEELPSPLSRVFADLKVEME